ncbi:MAG: hypothetical protein QCH35_08680 [Methanomicrobiaceae archaeon]|nr:hypothetical protein [Methanomicrobiaceae archaeon]
MNTKEPDRWAVTLDRVIAETGELDHLYTLVEERSASMEFGSDTPLEIAQLTVEKVINPILTALEVHLRENMTPHMTPEEVKEIVHAWIEKQRKG